MAFTVEDGTGVDDANAYITVAYADTHFSDRGRTDWSEDSAGDPRLAADKQAAIIRATDHIERRFGHRFKGTKAVEGNVLSWPREGVTLNNGTEVDDDEIPELLKRACAEYARLALSRTELDPVPVEVGADKTGRVQRKVTANQVGSLKQQVQEEYEDISQRVESAQRLGDRPPSSNLVSEASLMEYPAADTYLEQLVIPIDARDRGSGATPCVSGNKDKKFEEGWDDQFDYDGHSYTGIANRYGYY